MTVRALIDLLNTLSDEEKDLPVSTHANNHSCHPFTNTKLVNFEHIKVGVFTRYGEQGVIIGNVQPTHPYGDGTFVRKLLYPVDDDTANRFDPEGVFYRSYRRFTRDIEDRLRYFKTELGIDPSDLKIKIWTQPFTGEASGEGFHLRADIMLRDESEKKLDSLVNTTEVSQQAP